MTSRHFVLSSALLFACCSNPHHESHNGLAPFPLERYVERVDGWGSPSDDSVRFYPDLISAEDSTGPRWRQFARDEDDYLSRQLYYLREPVLSVRPLSGTTIRLTVHQASGRPRIVRVTKNDGYVEVVSKTSLPFHLGMMPVVDSIKIFRINDSIWDTIRTLAENCGLDSAHPSPSIDRFHWSAIWVVEEQYNGRYSFDFSDWPFKAGPQRRFGLLCLYLYDLGKFHPLSWEVIRFNPREMIERETRAIDSLAEIMHR